MQLDLTLRHEQLRAHYHLVAYPHTAVFRQWVQLENVGASPLTLSAPMPVCLHLRGDDATALIHHWLIGGNSGPTQGLLQTHEITTSYHQVIDGRMTDNFVPWMAVKRKGTQRVAQSPSAVQNRSGQPRAAVPQTSKPCDDGSFVALEYLGAWRLALDHEKTGATIVSAAVPELNSRSLGGGERVELPVVTFGVFARDLDGMAAQLYDWQYEYLWDYTHDDWYALMSHPVAWWPDSHNLQENFAGRLGGLDVDGVDTMRGMGFELLWDDAGWSESPNIRAPHRAKVPISAKRCGIWKKRG